MRIQATNYRSLPFRWWIAEYPAEMRMRQAAVVGVRVAWIRSDRITVVGRTPRVPKEAIEWARRCAADHPQDPTQ